MNVVKLKEVSDNTHDTWANGLRKAVSNFNDREIVRTLCRYSFATFVLTRGEPDILSTVIKLLGG